MASRMTNPSLAVPGALPPLLELTRVIGQVGLPQRTLDLIRLRASQLNGRSIRITAAPGSDGEPDERLSRVATWRDATCFTDGERAVLALTEAATRLDPPEDPVPDEVWAAVAAHYDEARLGAVVLQIGLVNLWNRLNVTTDEQPAELS